MLDAAGPGGPPALGPARGARHLPGVARAGRQLRPAAGVRRRGVGGEPDRLAAYLRPGRAAHRLRLRLRAGAVGRGRAAAGPRAASLRGARQRRGARDVGAVEPRHHPARHAGSGGRSRRGRSQELRQRQLGRPSTSCSAAGAPGRRCCSSSPCPAASTSTRARSSASRRSRTCRRSCCRTRPGSARGTPSAAGTAAGCRCRGRTSGPSLGFGAGHAVAAAAGGRGRSCRWRRRNGDPDSMLSLYRAALHLRRELPALGAGTGERRPLARPRQRRRRLLRGSPGSRWSSTWARDAAAAVGRGAARERPADRRPAARGHRGVARHG